MRLSEFEILTIKNSVRLLDEKAKVYLFASRIDDKQKGGDIDILVISDKINQSDSYIIKSRIFEKLEEQKIDILIKQKPDDAFTKYIFKSVIEL